MRQTEEVGKVVRCCAKHKGSRGGRASREGRLPGVRPQTRSCLAKVSPREPRPERQLHLAGAPVGVEPGPVVAR